MASKNESERKCFTLIWKIENASYYWPKKNGSVATPDFLLKEIGRRKWRLGMTPRCGDQENYFLLFFGNYLSDEVEENPGFVWELALLSSDGTVELSDNNYDGLSKTPALQTERENLFVAKRSIFLPQDTLTARIKIWKNDGEMLENVHSIARTVIVVEKASFTWKVRNFSYLKPMTTCSYEVKSLAGELLMILDLFLNDEPESRKIRFAVTPKSRIRCCTFQLSLVQTSGNRVECLKDEFRFDEDGERKEFTQFITRNVLMEKKSDYLPNDILTLRCKCCFSNDHITEAIEEFSSDYTIFHDNSTNLCEEKENVLSKSQNVLSDKLKTMLKDSIHTDIKLRTSKKSYPAHKCVLSMWSPVFNAMFSNDMREKINDCVDIDDLSDDTVSRLLQYIYSAEIEELEWDDATDLYEAADKYQILTLKDICASFLKTNLCQNNACAALLLADLHQDTDLKCYVQDFILKHGKDIMNSDEWKDLMKTNANLAAETIYLKFKE